MFFRILAGILATYFMVETFIIAFRVVPTPDITIIASMANFACAAILGHVAGFGSGNKNK
jgi:hypothetical protein